jgi:hypothetical protein
VKKGHNVWDVMRDIRIKAEKRCRKILTDYYKALLKDFEDPKFRENIAKRIYAGSRPGAPERTEEQQKKNEEFALKRAQEGKWGFMEAHDFIYREYRLQRAGYEKNPFDLDVALAIRQKAGCFYLIPYSGSGLLSGCLKFLDKHPALEDWHYQNQSDRPENITAREWKARERLWNYLMEDERWPDKLVLDIVTADGFERVDPWFKYLADGWKKQAAKERKIIKKAKAAKAAQRKTA